GVVHAQNFRLPNRARTSSHRGTQNPRRDTPDEQGANSPSRLAAAGPDPLRLPQWSGLPRRSTIWSLAPIPELRAQPATLPARPPTNSRLPHMLRTILCEPPSTSIQSLRCPWPICPCPETVSPSSRIHLGLEEAMELAVSVIGQMASQNRLWESAGFVGWTGRAVGRSFC